MVTNLVCADTQVFDGYLVKYGATAVALLAYAAPMYMRRGTSTASQDDLTQDYIRSMRLLQNTARWALCLLRLAGTSCCQSQMESCVCCTWWSLAEGGLAPSFLNTAHKSIMRLLLRIMQGCRRPGAGVQAGDGAGGPHLPRVRAAGGRRPHVSVQCLLLPP